MTEQQVKDTIGKENWKAFYSWMRGQTIGVLENGEHDYYPWDVKAFKDKLDTGFDRQDSGAWD